MGVVSLTRLVVVIHQTVTIRVTSSVVPVCVFPLLKARAASVHHKWLETAVKEVSWLQHGHILRGGQGLGVGHSPWLLELVGQFQ